MVQRMSTQALTLHKARISEYVHRLEVKKHMCNNFLIEGEPIPPGLESRYLAAFDIIYDAGRRGEPMSEALFIDAVRCVGEFSYRTANCNSASFHALRPDLIRIEIAKLLGATVFQNWEDTVYPGWYNEYFEPTWEFIADFHIRFEEIHPLVDGNGRWGRVLMVHPCARAGFPIPLIPVARKNEYKDYVHDEDVLGLARFLAEKCMVWEF